MSARFGCLVTGLLFFTVPGCSAQQSPIHSLSFRAKGAEVPLSTDSRQRLAGKIEKIVMSQCMFDSVHYPMFFADFKPAQDWNQAMAEDHLYVRFARPFRSWNVEGQGVEISEALVGLEDDDFLKSELTRHAGKIVAHSKCDGYGLLGVMCDPALAAYLRPGQAKMCQSYREQQQRRSPADGSAGGQRPGADTQPAPSAR